MDLGPLIVKLQEAFDLYGAQTAVMVVGENNLPLTITDVRTEYSEGGSTLWIKVEEF